MKFSASRLLNITWAALAVIAIGSAFAPNASAGCGDSAWNAAALNSQPSRAATSESFTASAPLLGIEQQPERGGADIVGMWQFKFLAKNSAPIPDGTVLDAGYAQWHSDGTEFTNSSRRP